KYSIDHNLINPLTRIMLGYFLGVGVLLVGIKLKKKYEFFSAVLVSGAIAIMYFDTFVAYSLYEIFPQLVAFGLMIFFTIFTVLAAINYNRQIIAHIALVGSYAIPILLSDGSGNVFALFTYMTIINAGILVLGFKKDWKPLYYVAFSATWIIFLIWYVGAPYQTANHFKIGMGYATIFFLLFYVTFLAYKLIKKEQFVKSDIILIILNSTVFYGLCFNMLDRHDLGVHYVGLFTLGTACIHFAVSVILYKTKLADRNLFYLSSGMVLAFLTIAIPVQLSGTWITLLWGIEALVLFWIGRTKGVRVYEFLSYPVMLIAVGGLVMDWLNFYSYNSSVVESYDPLMNLTFLTSLIVCVSLSVILYFNQQARFGEKLRTERPELLQGFTALLTIATIAVVYFTFKLELDLYFNKMYYETKILASSASAENPYFVFNDDIFKFRTAWAINYSLAFCLALLFLNSAKIKSRALSIGALSLSAAVIIIFLNLGLYELSQLTRSYKGGTSDVYFNHGSMSIALRYISYALVAGLLFMMFKGIKDRLTGAKMYFDLFMHTTILWILCAELMNMTDLASIGDQDKLGLSILAGLYAVFLVALGIAKRTAYLRIAAFTVFGITLVKLFFYDLVQLTTISKTIVFIALGVILLIVSFMYNKYKHTFTDEK
ncbi:MAG: putative membrane protein, partial [Arenicella sp.]